MGKIGHYALLRDVILMIMKNENLLLLSLKSVADVVMTVKDIFACSGNWFDLTI